MRTPKCFLWLAVLVGLSGLAAAAPATFGLQRVQASSTADCVEIRGVGAGRFNSAFWETNTLHLVPDVRSPLLAPRPGAFRNIYAPSAVWSEHGWRVFYGGWDGVPTGNDRIYSAETQDFLTFSNRHTVIEHGAFIHVCNVNALRLADGSYSMVCTAYPDKNKLNKPSFYASRDGKSWNGSQEPYKATQQDIASIQGYPNYDGADINGMNVIMHEDGQYRLYFGDFRNFDSVFRASSKDGRHYAFDGEALAGRFAVNDVRKFRGNAEVWYLMGLHFNCDKLWFALSRDGLHFEKAQLLATNLSETDRYIVALGWVVSGEQEAPDRSVLGFLYGAGPSPQLASNSIFARWLQKRVTLLGEDGVRHEGHSALGPDRTLVPVPAGKRIRGTLRICAEDGETPLGTVPDVDVGAGEVYTILSR